MVTRNLIEAASLVSAPSEGETWKVRLINEGRGSSGTYSRQLLENYHHAFDDVISFLNHPSEGPETRNFTEIAGRVVGQTWLETAEDGTTGVYANWEPDEDHRRKLEKYKDKLGLSIYISGSGEMDDDSGEFRVQEFDTEDPFRSVDVVIAAGRGGRFEESAMKKMYESRRDSEQTGATSAQETERKLMDEKKVLEALEAIQSALNVLVTDKKAKESQEAQVAADEAAVEERVAKVTSNLDAVEAARDDLLPSQVDSLRAEAKSGKDITPLIESAKKVKADALAAVQASESGAPGREFGTSDDVRFTGFGGGK